MQHPHHTHTMIHRCLAVCVLLCLAGLPFSVLASGLSIVPGPQEETIILQIPDTKKHKLFTLKNPDRLVIDVPKLEDANAIELPHAYQGELVKNVRTGLFTTETTRIVFDLTGSINITKVRAGRQDLTIKIASVNADPADSGAGFLDKLEPPRVPNPRAGKDIIDDVYVPKRPQRSFQPPAAKKPSVPAPKPAVLAKPAPAAKVRTQPTRPLHRVVPDKPMIVIDAGHGGVDPGATGTRGSVEKDIVLDYALELEKKLQASGRYRIKLTRRNDQYIALRERVEIARRHGADLFISLHADSAPGSAHGLSIYTVSEKASDEEAQALAARENKSDIIAGIDLENERKDVADILISLAERDTKNRSATLADMVVIALKGHVDLLPETHRFAGFAVLKAPDVPSVLIEIGFLSHSSEEKRITSSSHRKKVVAKIADAIDNYFRKENTLWIP